MVPDVFGKLRTPMTVTATPRLSPPASLETPPPVREDTRPRSPLALTMLSCPLLPLLHRCRPPPSPLLLLLLSRPLHSSPPELDLSHPTLIVWGSNTGVGKTLVSAGLAASVLSPSSPNPATFLYLKPVQTGFPRDSDSRFVYRKVSNLFSHRLGGFSAQLLASNHALKASVPAAREVLGARTERPEEEGEEASTGLCCYEETRVGTGESTKGDFKLVCKMLYGWKEAISPHLAVEREGMAVSDSSLREVLGRLLSSSTGGLDDGRKEKLWRVIETAGGVASPGPSGSIQCDLYRSVLFLCYLQIFSPGRKDIIKL